jgi:hypothetical protein
LCWRGGGFFCFWDENRQAEENAYRFRELVRLGNTTEAKNIDLKLAVVDVFK